MTPHDDARFRDKTIATLLAAAGGTLGLHRFYLVGARRWWPWLYPAFAWTLIPTFAGFIEALRFATTPDDRWDERWNPGSSRKSRSGWPVVILAVATLFGGVLLLMTLLAYSLGRLFGAGESFF